MPDTDILECAAASELEPEPYDLSDRDHRTLVKYGLLRPAMAGNADDPRIALDSLFALIRANAPKLTAPDPMASDLPGGAAAPRPTE